MCAGVCVQLRAWFVRGRAGVHAVLCMRSHVCVQLRVHAVGVCSMCVCMQLRLCVELCVRAHTVACVTACAGVCVFLCTAVYAAVSGRRHAVSSWGG